ncbi:hypothetical protein PINS_up013565 [Pythium insidiosum]|nr:hypothetical protein PINS_up013565 [Pythium insidiosum]
MDGAYLVGRNRWCFEHERQAEGTIVDDRGHDHFVTVQLNSAHVPVRLCGFRRHLPALSPSSGALAAPKTTRGAIDSRLSVEKATRSNERRISDHHNHPDDTCRATRSTSRPDTVPTNHKTSSTKLQM